jgi:DNA-binding IclR family transcriptional regulator
MKKVDANNLNKIVQTAKVTNSKSEKLNLKTDPGDNIQSKSYINRIAATLVGLSKGKNSVTEIADDCNFSISTAHRLLNVLLEPGFTIYDPTNHQYYLGPLISQLAENPDITHQFLLRATANEMKRLSSVTEETISLNMLLGIQLISLGLIQSKYSLRVQELDENDKGRPSLAPIAAGQNVLLSQLDENKLNLILKSVKILDDPLIDIEQVRKELKQTNEQGYAITRGLRIPDVMAISVPVKNYIWPLALTILGPVNRLERRVSTFTTELLTSADRISSNIQKFFQ